MRIRVTGAARLAVIAVVAVSAMVSLAPQASAGVDERRGCPPASLCIYPQNAGWNHNHPSNIYWEDYQTQARQQPHVWYNLRNQRGVHRVFNNTMCADVTLNKGYNGAGPFSRAISEGRSFDWNLTPVNSVTLRYTCGW